MTVLVGYDRPTLLKIYFHIALIHNIFYGFFLVFVEVLNAPNQSIKWKRF